MVLDEGVVLPEQARGQRSGGVDIDPTAEGLAALDDIGDSDLRGEFHENPGDPVRTTMRGDDRSGDGTGGQAGIHGGGGAVTYRREEGERLGLAETVIEGEGNRLEPSEGQGFAGGGGEQVVEVT